MRHIKRKKLLNKPQKDEYYDNKSQKMMSDKKKMQKSSVSFTNFWDKNVFKKRQKTVKTVFSPRKW